MSLGQVTSSKLRLKCFPELGLDSAFLLNLMEIFSFPGKKVEGDFFKKLFLYIHTYVHRNMYTCKSCNFDVFRSHVQGCSQEFQLNLKSFLLRDTTDMDIGCITPTVRG